MYFYVPNDVDQDHLLEVIEAMRELGAPRLLAVDAGDCYELLEGSHRMAAARQIGLKPVIVLMPQDELIDGTTFDWFEEAREFIFGPGEDGEQTMLPAGRLAGFVINSNSRSFDLDAETDVVFEAYRPA